MNKIIEFKQVSKIYRKGPTEVPVHRDLNLSINEGEFIALMGPSGSGKTTLLHMMGGLDRPSKGDVFVAGKQVSQCTEAQLTRWRSQHLGFVFQENHLLPTLSTFDNVELPLIFRNLSKSQRKAQVENVLSLVNMEERSAHRPKELSGGQEQRVAIARALVGDPDVILCDEPTGNLDRRTADSVLSLLQVLNQEFGKTIVMVTHDPKAAEYCSRVINLEDYQVEAQVLRSVGA